jgi:hypothetical protein
VVEDGGEELELAGMKPAFNAFSAGLNISFSTIVLAIVGELVSVLGLAAPSTLRDLPQLPWPRAAFHP